MFNAFLDNPGITVFGFKIYAYALCIVAGMICAYFLITLLFKRRNMSGDLFTTFFCVTLPIALFTTRLFYCITDGMPINEWFSFESLRQGGLSIIGGILGGVLSVTLVSLVKKVNFLRATDCILIGVLLAQSIGRWGNFANQEVYGGVIENPAFHCFPFGVYIHNGGSCVETFTLTFAKWFGTETSVSGGTWHYAFFFYESFANLTAAVLMFIFAWKNPKKPNGVLTAWYFIHYGLVRSIMEPLRDPSYILSAGDVPWSLVLSLCLFFGGCVLLVAVLVWNKRKEGQFFGSKNGDPFGITDYIGDSKNEKPVFSKINMMCAHFPEKYEKQPEKTTETNGRTVKGRSDGSDEAAEKEQSGDVTEKENEK